MSQLFDSVYGKDHLQYKFIQGKGTIVHDSDDPRHLFQYDHDTWEANYNSTTGSIHLDSSKLPKSLAPKLNACSQQRLEETATCISPTEPLGNSLDVPTTPMPAVNKPVPAAQSSPKCKPSVTGPTPPSNTPSVIHLDLTNSTDSIMSSGNGAWLTMISNLTRKQLSNISVPQVSANPFQSTSIVGVCGSFNETEPLELHERPPKTVLEEADKTLGKKQGNGYPTGVVIPRLGTFSRAGITILKKFCKISSLKALIRSEERWLDENSDGLSMPETWAIKEVLWNQGENKTVLKVGDKSIDVASFSTLVGEQYLDNFVIDVSTLCFLQDFKGRSRTLFSPVKPTPG